MIDDEKLEKVAIERKGDRKGGVMANELLARRQD